MDIKCYRTIRWGNTHLSFEAKVTDGDNTYYVNIDVNDKGNKEEIYDDGHWAYNVPLDSIDDWSNVNKYIVDDVNFDDVLKRMLQIWNNNPIFDESAEWKYL